MLHPIIMVVDDNTDYLAFMTTLLALSGYTVLTCQKSGDAHALIRKRQPDFALLDIRMEHAESGFDLLRELRTDAATAHIPVLLCSADLEALQAFDATNQDERTRSLAKPFELADLLNTLTGMARFKALPIQKGTE